MINIININDLPAETPRKTNARKDIEEFINSNEKACEIEIPEGKKLVNVRNSYVSAAKKMDPSIKVITRSERLFMIKVVDEQSA